MSKIPENKNEFVIWLNTNEGQDCIQPQDFTKPGSTKYLENRLWYAWTAGMGKQLEHSLERIGELEKEVERIKKVAANAFHEFRMRGFPHNEPTWEQFKTANNL